MNTNRRVIVNADDLGWSETVNEAIFECFDRGVVTSATLLTGGPAVHHAIEGVRDRPGLGVGVHLDTSEFDPMTKAFADVRSANPDLDLRTARWIAPSVATAVKAEWLAQIGRARELGAAITHVDSHHFDHVNPLLLPSLVAVCRMSGLSRVRRMQNLYVDPRRSLVRLVKSVHAGSTRAVRLRSTDYMSDVDTFLRLAAESRLPSAGTFELMAHPGHPKYEAETVELLASRSLFEQSEMISWRGVR